MNSSNGNYYHIFNRGANREPILFNEANYLYLLKLIKKYLKKYDITLACYCLMPNHYHFIPRQNSDAPISRFLQTTFNAYTQALNKQQNRKGTLFESRPKSIQIEDESYLVYLFRYIHLNPVSAGIVSSPEQWAYSNYCEFIGQRNGSLFDKELFHKYLTPAWITGILLRIFNWNKVSKKNAEVLINTTLTTLRRFKTFARFFLNHYTFRAFGMHSPRLLDLFQMSIHRLTHPN